MSEWRYTVRAYEDPFQGDPAYEVRRRSRGSAIRTAKRIAPAMWEVDVYERDGDDPLARSVAVFVAATSGVLSFGR